VRAALRATSTLVLAAALSACAAVPPGISVADPATTDRVFARELPRGWSRMAVLPFAGDPAHRRPAEEYVTVRVRQATRLAVITPYAAQRFLESSRAAPFDADGWTAFYFAPPPAVPPPDALRAFAKALAVDAVILGRVAPGGASADLVLVDGASGAPIAVLRRAGSPGASEAGVHELAMNAVGRAADDLALLLQGRPPENTQAPPLPRGPERDAQMGWQ
jgi:hypothetical protein